VLPTNPQGRLRRWLGPWPTTWQIIFGCTMAVSGLVVFLATTSGYFHTLGAFMMLGGVSATAGGTFRRLRQRRTPPNDR